MVMYSQLPIYRDSYMLLMEIYQVTDKFPRASKYTLGQDMKRDVLNLFRDLYGANSYLEQMTSVAEQALESLSGVEGIVEIRSGMSASEINALITDNAQILLREDITLDDTITITSKNVSFNGLGHTISFAGSGSATTSTKAAIEVKGEEASADFKNIKMEISGDWAVGISSRDGANITIDNTYGITTSGENSYRISHRDELLYSGKYNTQAILAQSGVTSAAANAVNDYYAAGVAADDADFGQGQWYLGSFGELLDVYGYDKSAIPAGTSSAERTQGAIGDNKATINTALTTLANRQTALGETVTSEALTNSWYWSSSEY